MLVKIFDDIDAILNEALYGQKFKKEITPRGSIRITPILADNPKKVSVPKPKNNTLALSKLIKKVIFANPKTIVLWKDGSKTVVTAQKEKFDKEKGILMAFYKHYFGREYMADLLEVIDNAEEVKKGSKQ